MLIASGYSGQLKHMNAYDAIHLFSFGIRNVTKIDNALKEAFRVLKPGGRFMCLEFSKVDNEILNIGFDEEITILKLAENIHNIMKKDFSDVIFKDAWKNDTKWRKPDLIKLKKYIGNYSFTSL